MLEVLKNYDGAGYVLHAYVVMPDHLHLLLTPQESIEKAVQLIKGGFSFRLKRELGMNGEIWQQGFTDHRIRDSEDWERHLEYIRLNPVEARLVEDTFLYEWTGFPNICFPQGLKPQDAVVADVRAEARTLHTREHPDGTAEAWPFQSNDEFFQNKHESALSTGDNAPTSLK
jgi:putative transposase